MKDFGLKNSKSVFVKKLLVESILNADQGVHTTEII